MKLVFYLVQLLPWTKVFTLPLFSSLYNMHQQVYMTI